MRRLSTPGACDHRNDFPPHTFDCLARPPLRFRKSMVSPGRDQLTGTVEADETFIGGIKPGKRGRGAVGKTLVAVADSPLRRPPCPTGPFRLASRAC